MKKATIKIFSDSLVCFFSFCLQGVLGSSFWGGVVLLASEELMESVIEYLPKVPTIFKNYKLGEKLLDDIKCYYNDFNDREKRELIHFVCSISGAAMPKKLSTQFNKIMEKTEGDPFNAVSAIDGMSEQDAKVWIKNIMKVFHKSLEQAYKEIENLQNDKFNVKTEDVCLALCGKEWNECPESAKKFLKLIERQVYELKYLKMGDEERDMVLVLSQMVEEKNADLIAQLKPMLNHMAQVNEYAARIDPELKVADIAKADPFCYFPLECPECGAVGTRVYRDSNNNVHCRSCGKSFGIIQAVQDKDIKEEFKRVKKQLQEQCAKSDQIISGKIEILASKIVGVEYFDAFQEKIKAQSENTVLAVTDILKQSESNIKTKLTAIAEELKENNSNELVKRVSQQISTLESENQAQLKEMYNSILNIRRDLSDARRDLSDARQDIGDVKSMCRILLDQTSSEHLLKEIYHLMMNQSRNSVIEKPRLCPRCGLEATFKRNADENDYVCQCCGFAIYKNDINKNSVSSDAVQMKMVLSFNSELTMRYNGKINNDANRSVVCISILDSEVVGMLNNKSLTLSSPNWVDGNSLKPTILILRGGDGVRVGEEAVKRIVDLFKQKPSVSSFVFGGGTNAPNAPNFDGWSYDPELHKLSKNT